MNLGQRIWQKTILEQPIDNEIKEIEAIIDQIDENERSVPEIDLNLELNTIYKEIEIYIKIVDEKLFEIRNKYFKPNGLYFTINICKTELCEVGFLAVDSCEDTTIQTNFDFIKDEEEETEYSYCSDLHYKWEEYLLDDLLAALNINKLAVMLGAMWYIDDWGDKNFKLIETNKDT